MNLLVLGHSYKFTKFIKSIYPISNCHVIGWRDLTGLSEAHLRQLESFEWDLILIAGYDYSSCYYGYQKFIYKNVYLIINFLKKFISKNTTLVYINTFPSSKKKTFSRYYYAKMLLGVELGDICENLICLNFPTVFESNKITIKGGVFTRIITKFLIKIKFIECVLINDDPLKNSLIYKNFRGTPCSPKPIFLSFPRPVVLDRLLRLFFG